jgi:hypothetical protein
MDVSTSTFVSKATPIGKGTLQKLNHRPIRKDLGFDPKTKVQEGKYDFTVMPQKRGTTPACIIIVSTGEPSRDFMRNHPT